MLNQHRIDIVSTLCVRWDWFCQCGLTVCCGLALCRVRWLLKSPILALKWRSEFEQDRDWLCIRDWPHFPFIRAHTTSDHLPKKTRSLWSAFANNYTPSSLWGQLHITVFIALRCTSRHQYTYLVRIVRLSSYLLFHRLASHQTSSHHVTSHKTRILSQK